MRFKCGKTHITTCLPNYFDDRTDIYNKASPPKKTAFRYDSKLLRNFVFVMMENSLFLRMTSNFSGPGTVMHATDGLPDNNITVLLGCLSLDTVQNHHGYVLVINYVKTK